jgi:hypothetical protein
MKVNQNRNYGRSYNMSRISIPAVEQSPEAAKPLLPTDIDFPVINVRLAA